MKLRLFNSCVTIALLFPVQMVSASDFGSSSADILKMPVGTRAIGMGEAYAAQADDISSLYWNPAGLAFLNQGQASFLYTDWFQGISYNYGAVGIPLENGGLGASLSYLGYGNIKGYDIYGNSIGNQRADTEVASFGGSLLLPMGALGITAKGLQEALADTTARAAAFDVGGTFVSPQPVLNGTLRLSAVVQNIGPGIHFIQQTDPLPMQWKLGTALVQLAEKKLNVSFDLVKPRDTPTALEGGAEYWICPYLALRTGYSSSSVEGSGIRAGLGFRVKDISFDYAYASYGELGIVHRYELTFRFGQPRPLLTPDERKILKQAKAALRNGEYEKAVLLFDSLINLEPMYKPARRLIKIAMKDMEEAQQQMLAQQGKTYNTLQVNMHQSTHPELDDLEELFNLDTDKTAQRPEGINPGELNEIH